MAQVTWTSTNDGLWSDGVNWSGAAAPLSSDDAVVAAATGGLLTLSGPGSSASLTLLDNTALGGVFNTGTVSVGRGSTGGALTLLSGASLTAASTLTVAGGQSASLSSGSAAQVGGLVLAGGANVAVAQGASLEVGMAGSSGGGTITVDSGSVVSGAGALSAPGIVDNGLIVAQGGTLQVSGPVTGSGSLQIGAGATLQLSAGMSGANLAFADGTGTLQVAEAGNGTVAAGGTISGLVAGDVIDVTGAMPVTSVGYTAAAGGGGYLTLMDGSSAVGRLALQGAYGGAVFHVAADPQQGADITVTTPVDPLFDATYYLAHNPHVAAAGIDPYQHYLAFGGHEGRSPDAFFDSSFYLTANPDVRAAGVNPLAHFEAFGWKEGRDPSLLFSDSKYLAANPDVASAGLDPLQHYIQYGQFEGRIVSPSGGMGTPDALVDAGFYDAQLGATLVPTGAAGAQQAQASYDNGGWQQGLNPDALFNTSYYLANNPDVAAAHIDPLVHYEAYGWQEGRDPSAAFSTNQYLAANTDVAAAGLNPLLHYVVYGQAEGRAAFHV